MRASLIVTLFFAGAFVGLGVETAAIWPSLPARVATHFDWSGAPNGWAPRPVLLSVMAGADGRDPLTYPSTPSDFLLRLERDWKGVRVAWSRPSGQDLEAVAQRLKALKLTIRNAPEDQPDAFGVCIFTGRPGVEEILIGRAY